MKKNVFRIALCLLVALILSIGGCKGEKAVQEVVDVY